jgi:nucleoside 2-deoxyribosyltransferase
MNAQPRIYLAGPDLFHLDAANRYARLKAACARHGLVGVSPLDVVDFPVQPTRDCARRLREVDLHALKSCQAVMANVTPFNGLEPDSGTAYEMGFAAAMGLPVVAYCFDGLTVMQRTQAAGLAVGADGRSSAGLLVEDFDLCANLMLTAEHDCIAAPGLSVDAVVDHAARGVAQRLGVSR